MTRTSNRTSASVLALLASVGLCLGVACASKPIVANSPIDHEEKIVQRASYACTNAQKQRERVSLLMSQGRLQRALRIIDKADALCPDSEKESRGMKLLALAELGRRADAEKLISQMLTNGTSEAQQAVASAKELLRKSLPTVTKDLPAEGTIERRAIEEARRQARDLIVQGRGLVEKGEYVKAKENFLAAWGLRHPFGAVLLEAGLAAKQAGESAESQRLFDRAIEELEAQTGEKMKFELPNKVLGFSGSSLVFSHDSQTFSFLKGHEISIRSTVTLREKIKLVDQDEIGAISISPDGKTLLSSSWGKLRFWDAGTGDLVRTIKTGNLFHVAPAFSPDGSEIGYFDNSSGVVRITNLKDGREVSTKTSFVSDLQFSPDGTLLAVNLFHSTAIMEAKTGKIRYSITHPIGRKQSPSSVVVRFVDGGKSILSFWRDHLWAVYDAETGALVKQKKLFRSGPEYCLDQADLSPNLATMAMITCDNTFVYYDLVREKEILRETKVSHPVRVLYAPDGNNLLVQTDNGFSKLDVSTLRWQHSFFSHSDPSIAVEMNEKESILLTSSKYGVNGLWDINGEAFRWFRTKAKNLDSATFHSDGVSVLTSGLDMSFAGQHLIECWDANSAKPCRDPVIVAYGIPLLGRDTSLSGYGNELVWFDTLTGKEKRKEKLVGGNAESPEGPLVLGGSQESGLYLVADMNGTVWEISANDELPTAVIRTPTGSFDGILSLTASRAGILRAFAENNGNVAISSLAGSTKCQTSRSVRAMKFSDDESMLACGSTVLQICDTARGEILRQFDEQNGSITSVKFSPDGKWLISGSDDGTTRLWNLRYGEKMPLPRRHRESVDSIGVSSNGDVIVTSAKDSVLIWDKPSGQLIRKEYPHSVLDSTVFALDPSGQKIALRFDTNLALVDTHDNTVHSVIPNVSLRVRALRFSHRGKVLAAVSDKNLTLWDTQTGKVIWEIPYIAGPKDRLAFSADDTKIHIGSDASLTTWDVTGGLRLSSVALPTTFRGVLSDDFRRFASIGAKGEILISDTSTGSNLQTITGVNYYLDSLALSEDGSYLLAAVGPEIWLWDLTSGDVLRKFKREHGASVSTLHLAQRLGVFVIGYQDGSVEARDLVTGEMLPNWPAAKRPEMRELVKRDATMIPKDLKQSVTLVTHSHYPAGYILYGGGFIEMRAADADSLRQLKELPICRFGSLSFPFELCEERFRVPTGTLANWMKGDFGAFEPLPPATNLVYPLSTHSYRWRMNDNMTSAPRTVSSVKDIHRIPDDERWVGPFWLRKQLGEGGFAPVWLAEERYGDFKLRDVAIKLFLVPSSADQTVRRERILEEARTLCLVQHPNVVAFYSVYLDEPTSLIGLAMEFVAGKSLFSKIFPDPLSVAETVRMGIAVASALTAVHQVGLVHRDIKPANIIESPTGYKLIDFGIAAAGRKNRPQKKIRTVVLDDVPFELGTRSVPMSELGEILPEDVISAIRESEQSLGEDNSGAQQSGIFVSGTMGYIDPVCVANPLEVATAASDLYALGVTLFECLCTCVPAVAAAKSETRRGFKGEVLDGRVCPPSITQVVPSIPKRLGELIDALVQPEREKRPPSAEWVARELEKIRAEMAGRARLLPSEERGPFRGLGRFEAVDRDVFFARSNDVAAVLEMFRSKGLVALVGASGTGKSSLARAGVLPSLQDGGLTFSAESLPWRVVTFVPGINPKSSLFAAIQQSLSIELPTEDEDPKSFAARLIQFVQRDLKGREGVILFVDQAEELVTVAKQNSHDVDWVAALLVALGQLPLPGIRVLMTARQDLLDRFVAMGELGKQILRGAHVVLPLNDAAWGDVLDQALSSYGVSFESSSLRAMVLSQLRGTISAMPLVQFALTQLWEHRDPVKKLLTEEGLNQIGGITGALERHANNTLELLRSENPLYYSIASQILLFLTTPQGTRATKPLAKILSEVASPHTTLVVNRLENARLVTSEDNGYSLMHETLLTHWGVLHKWVALVRADRELADEIERDADRWFKASRDETMLWQKSRLLRAKELLSSRRAVLTPQGVLFLDAASRRERRGRMILVTALAISLVMIGSATGLYIQQRNQAFRTVEHALQTAESEKEKAEVQRKRAEQSETLSKQVATEAEEKRAEADQNLKKAEAIFLKMDEKLSKATTLAEVRKIQEETSRLKKGEPSTTPPSPVQQPTAPPINPKVYLPPNPITGDVQVP